MGVCVEVRGQLAGNGFPSPCESWGLTLTHIAFTFWTILPSHLPSEHLGSPPKCMISNTDRVCIWRISLAHRIMLKTRLQLVAMARACVPGYLGS